MIKRVYIPYYFWEDWLNGMWRKVNVVEEKGYLEKAIEFTGNHILYGSAMNEVVLKWPKTMQNSLTNSSINQKAFVGHCACCLSFGCPEYIVRLAWGKLTEEQRFLANMVAQKAIESWRILYKNKYQLCFDFGN